MKKTIKEKSKNRLGDYKLLLAVGLVVGFVIFVFVFRGWVRMTLIPKTIVAVHGNSAHKAFVKETDKLQNPLALLGYKSLESEEGGCSTSLAQGISTQVICSYDVRAYAEIDQDSQSKAGLNANAEKLQNLLLENGWEGEYSDNGVYTSLRKLVSSITAGIDYQPDATYQKQIGHVLCFFHSNTAFSTPKPPAIATQISCSRTFNFLGKPAADIIYSD